MTSSEMIREILHAQLSGDLEAGMAEEIRTWFIGKGHEKEKFDALSEIWEKEITPIRKPSKKLDAEFRKIAKRLDFPEHIYIKAGEGNKSLFLRRIPKVAAVLLPIFILGASLLLIDLHRSNVEIADIPSFTVMAREGVKEVVAMPDSTMITLENGGVLTYSGDFTQGREVYIEGEAYFSVTHNPDMPFIVKTNSITVTAHGTEFQVKAYRENPTAEVKLTSGSVAVIAEGIEETMMVPGQHFVYDRSHRTGRVDNIAEGEMLRLLKQNLTLRGQTLEEAFIRMSQYFGLQFRVAPGIDITERIVASFTEDVTLEQALSIIGIILHTPFEYSIQADTVTITKRR